MFHFGPWRLLSYHLLIPSIWMDRNFSVVVMLFFVKLGIICVFSFALYWVRYYFHGYEHGISIGMTISIRYLDII